MRIAFTIHKFPPESLGGTEIYAWLLGRALVKLGHEAHVFYPLDGVADDARRIQHDGLHLWRAAGGPFGKPVGPARQYWRTYRNAEIEDEFRRFLAAVQPDIAHFQHVQGVSARLIALAAPRPRVLTLHDYWYFCANSQLIRPDRTICGGPKGGWNCAALRLSQRIPGAPIKRSRRLHRAEPFPG
jgi:glycosyltransferase involved in cell wall biosynthesis